MCMFGRGANCYLLKSLCMPCFAIRLLAVFCSTVCTFRLGKHQRWINFKQQTQFADYAFRGKRHMIENRYSFEGQEGSFPKILFSPAVRNKVKFRNQSERVDELPLVLSLSRPWLCCRFCPYPLECVPKMSQEQTQLFKLLWEKYTLKLIILKPSSIIF